MIVSYRYDPSEDRCIYDVIFLTEKFEIQIMITKMQLNFAVVVITLVCHATHNLGLLSRRSKGFRSAIFTAYSINIESKGKFKLSNGFYNNSKQ